MSGKTKRHYIKGNWSEEAKLLYRWYWDNDITETKDIAQLWDKLDDKLSYKTEKEIKDYIKEASEIRSKEIFSQLEDWHPGKIWGLPAPEGFKPGDEY